MQFLYQLFIFFKLLFLLKIIFNQILILNLMHPNETGMQPKRSKKLNIALLSQSVNL